MQWLLSSGVTAGGLVGLVVILVLSGRLVPRSISRAQVKQANDNAELWQKAYEKQSDRADLATAQTEKLLTGMATLEALLRALSPPSSSLPPGRGRR